MDVKLDTAENINTLRVINLFNHNGKCNKTNKQKYHFDQARFNYMFAVLKKVRDVCLDIYLQLHLQV